MTAPATATSSNRAEPQPQTSPSLRQSNRASNPVLSSAAPTMSNGRDCRCLLPGRTTAAKARASPLIAAPNQNGA